MINTRRWRRAATILLGLLAFIVPAAAPAAAVTAAPASAAAVPGAHHRVLPEPPSADDVRAELDKLVVETPHSLDGYSRARFPHWKNQFASCDTRKVVLARDGEGVTQDAQCNAVSGTWYSPYDGKTLTSAGQVDIDHMVPLANAWISGADGWDTKKRTAFANDLDNPQLIAVSAAANRSKGAKSPDQWAPPNADYWCTYSRAWTHVKSLYGLSITEPEKAKLGGMLNTCD